MSLSARWKRSVLVFGLSAAFLPLAAEETEPKWDTMPDVQQASWPEYYMSWRKVMFANNSSKPATLTAIAPAKLSKFIGNLPIPQDIKKKIENLPIPVFGRIFVIDPQSDRVVTILESSGNKFELPAGKTVGLAFIPTFSITYMGLGVAAFGEQHQSVLFRTGALIAGAKTIAKRAGQEERLNDSLIFVDGHLKTKIPLGFYSPKFATAPYQGKHIKFKYDPATWETGSAPVWEIVN